MDPQWTAAIEQRAVDMLANKVESRFQRINEDPVLNLAVQSGIKSVFDHGYVPDIARYVGSDRFTQSVDNGIGAAVSDVIANLSLDSTWLARVETMVNQQMHIKVNRYISELQIEQAIQTAVGSALDRWLENNPIVRTAGIDDQAQQTELTVMDGSVVVEGELAASHLLVTKDAKITGRMTVQDLDIAGSIDTTQPAWNQVGALAAQKALEEMTQEWKQSLITEVTDMIRDRGMDLSQVNVGGQPLLQDGRLSGHVKHSSLETVGMLERLDVQGAITGGAVTVRTQDVAVSMTTLDGTTGWIGTTDKRALTLGTGQQAHIVIEADGTVVMDDLRIGSSRIGFSHQVPGYRGERGDIVFNSEPAPGTAFAWVCLGAFSWQALKAS